MQMLPKKLEEQYGYTLFIRGRDDCPGEGKKQTFLTCMFYADIPAEKHTFLPA